MTMIGILPCAGKAERMNGLPKYLLPCPGGHLLGKHIREMQAVADSVWIGCNNDNKPFLYGYVPEEVGKANVGATQTMSETVLNMREDAHIGDADVLFGMPDTWWNHTEIYNDLRLGVTSLGWDVAVAVWSVRPDQRGQGGQVKIGDNGWDVVDVKDKNPNSDYIWIWGALAWKPEFWQYIDRDMPHVGYALMSAAKAGLNIKAIKYSGNMSFHDAGTPERYFELAATWAAKP